MKRIGWTVLAVIVLMGLTGCRGLSGPRPITNPAAPSVSVPLIPAPLDGAKFKADLCTAFSPEELRGLGFDPGEPSHSNRETCTYSRTGVVVGASLNLRPPANLRALYQDHAQGYATAGNHWEEVTVAGYPAVIVDIQLDPTSQQVGGCKLALGSDESTAIYLYFGTYGTMGAGPLPDPCGAVKKLAEVAIDRLRI